MNTVDTKDAVRVLRRHAEEQFAEELDELKKADTHPRPANWRMSPFAVCTYLLAMKCFLLPSEPDKVLHNVNVAEEHITTLCHE